MARREIRHQQAHDLKDLALVQGKWSEWGRCARFVALPAYLESSGSRKGVESGRVGECLGHCLDYPLASHIKIPTTIWLWKRSAHSRQHQASIRSA